MTFETTPDSAIDIDARDHGTVLDILPVSAAGEQWMLENVGKPASEGDGQWPRYAADHRYGPDILLGAHMDGLTVALNGRVADAPRTGEA